jgi:hypothetical protein
VILCDPGVGVTPIDVSVMFFNNPLMRLANELVGKCRRKKGHYVEIIAETTPLLTRGDPKADEVSEILETEFTLKDCEDLGE